MGRRRKKKKGIITDGEDDRISNLPESLIHHILSFLLMEDAIRTCLLSKRWRNIWKSVPVLNFGKLCTDKFIDQSLVHYEGQKVKKFLLGLYVDYWEDARRLESWVRFAAMHGVEELHLFAGAVYMGVEDHTLPNCLFECLELRVLLLSLDKTPPRPFCFPLLKELVLMDLYWNYLDTSACPLLEVLFIQISTLDSLEIYAPNLKLRYLNIREPNDDYDDNSILSLYAPNVLHFEFNGSLERFYKFKDISSVKTLTLHSSLHSNGYGLAESMMELLRSLTHVKSLKLSRPCILILAYGEMIGLKIPSLNAICLELETNLSKCALVGITSLVRASCCIERLIINMECRSIYDETSFEVHDIDAIEGWKSLEHALSVVLALSTILIRNFPGYFPDCLRDWYNGGMEPNVEKFVEYCYFEFKLVKLLLKSSKRLNKMNISIMKLPSQPLNSQYLDGLTKKLRVFPRASLNAEVNIS